MTDYTQKQAEALDKIAQTLDKLDVSLTKMDAADEGGVKHFYEQEKAMHEIKKLLREADMVDTYEQKAGETGQKRLGQDMSKQAASLGKIDKRMGQLDATLASLNETDNKVKSYIEQKKAVHEIREILRQGGRFDKYLNDGLNTAGAML